MQGNRKRPIRPPITISMLRSLRTSLNPNDPLKRAFGPWLSAAFGA